MRNLGVSAPVTVILDLSLLGLFDSMAMKYYRLMDTMDDIVRMSIEDLFPDQTIPDEESFLQDGNQYKAPDHLILNGQVAIERKSRNTIDRSQFYQKFHEISKFQGNGIVGYGRNNLKNMINMLPYQLSAKRKMMAFVTNKAFAHLRDARKKFESYEMHVPVSGQVRMAILSDNTKIPESTDFWQFEIGRRMGAYTSDEDILGIIDAVIFIKRPKFVIDRSKCYWFCCLVRKDLSKARRELAIKVASAIHMRVSTHAEIQRDIVDFPSEFTSLLV